MTSKVGGAWLVQFSIISLPLAFGVMESFYAQDYLSKFTPSQINWIGELSASSLLEYDLNPISRLYSVVFHVSTWPIRR